MATGETVTVACKLPNGLHLDLRDANGEVRRVTLRGSGDARRMESGGQFVSSHGNRVSEGFGLTPGVSKEFWEAWEAQYRKANYEPLVRGLIFAVPKLDSAAAMAREKAEIKTGLEPIDPAKKTGDGVEARTEEDPK